MFGLGAIISGAVSIVAGVCHAIGSVCGAIGGFVATKVLPFAQKVCSIVDAAGSFISTIAESFCGKPKSEEPEELAMKAEKAAEADIKPEQFDSVDSYIQHIRQEMQVNHEDMERLDPNERRVYRAIGLGLYAKQIDEAVHDELDVDFWGAVLQMKLTAAELHEIIHQIKEDSSKSGDMVVGWKTHSFDMGSEELYAANQFMKSAIKQANPGMDEIELAERLETIATAK